MRSPLPPAVVDVIEFGGKARREIVGCADDGRGMLAAGQGTGVYAGDRTERQEVVSGEFGLSDSPRR